MKTICTILLSVACFCSYAQPLSIPFPVPGSMPGRLIPKSPSDIWACYTLSSALSNTIARYDGKSWKTYTNHNQTKSYYRLTDFDVTTDDKIWAASREGLYYLDPADTANNRHFTTANSGLLSNELDFVAVSGNKVFIVSNKGVSIYNGQSFIHYTKADVPSLYYRITQVAAGPNGTFFVGTDQGLIVYENDAFKIYHAGNSELRVSLVTALAPDSKGRMWIGTFSAGGLPTLFCYDGRIITARASDCSAITSGIKNLAALADGKILIEAGETYTSPVTGNPLPRMFLYDADNYRMVSGYGDHISSCLASDNSFFYAVNQSSIRVYKQQEAIHAVEEPVLDANNISMPFLPQGDFGKSQAGGVHAFMPKGECKSPLHSGALWLGAELGNELYLAAAAYNRASDFYPGPFNKAHAYYDKESKALYNRVWKIDRLTVEQFKTGFRQGIPLSGIPAAIREWPAHGNTAKGQLASLAPFIDTDGDGRYNPENGDYPDIKGDMTLFWIMNDGAAGLEKDNFEFEVHGTAYSYACSDIKEGSPDEVLNNSVFMNYRVVNRSNRLYPSVKPGLWLDPDIGNRTGDFIGSDPKEGYGFAYNSTLREPGDDAYPEFPPALAVVPLSSNAQASAMENFMYYDNQTTGGSYEEQNGSFWHLMNSRFSNGFPLVYGGNGRDTTSADTARFAFPGIYDPKGRPEWKEEPGLDMPGNRMFLVGGKPFRIAPGESVSLDFAIVYSRVKEAAGYPAPLLGKLAADVKQVKSWFSANSFPSCGKLVAGIKDHAADRESLAVTAYPNPAGHALTVVHNLGSGALLQVFNTNGAAVYKAAGAASGRTINIGSLPPGLYFVQVSSPKGYKTIKILKQ